MNAPDVESELRIFERDGYVILPAVLAHAEQEQLTLALEPFERGRPMGRNEFEGERSQRVYSLAGKGDAFLRLAEHPRAARLLDALLYPGWLLSTLQSIRLHPGETPQPWHTDDAFYPVPRPLATRQALSFIWALEDFTVENGATEVIAGSHRWGMDHPDARPEARSRAVMAAGSVLVFEGALWHRGGGNASRGTRLCVTAQYCQPWLRPQESQLLLAPPEVARHASPGVRSMLGYSIHPPFVGQVDGMHPLRLIDADYRERKTGASAVADHVLSRPSIADANARELHGAPLPPSRSGG